MVDEQTIGFHKGAVDTLMKEKHELSKILQIVEHYLNAHIEALKKEGIDIIEEYKQAAAQAQPSKEEQPSDLDDRIA
ncbi:hypothetical protein HOD61_02200 [archaeon]|jgi:hypothetical protein|nr:hypothetical protein [archaeon]